MADGRGLPEAWRAIDELRSERREYVRRDVYVAERDADRKAIKRLEDDDTTKTSSNRAWLLNLAGIIVAAIVTGVITVLIARGGH